MVVLGHGKAFKQVTQGGYQVKGLRQNISEGHFLVLEEKFKNRILIFTYD